MLKTRKLNPRTQTIINIRRGSLDWGCNSVILVCARPWVPTSASQENKNQETVRHILITSPLERLRQGRSSVEGKPGYIISS
jgi:hypothetical protein